MKRTLLMMAAAAMLFDACCEKQCDTINPASAVMDNILNRKSVRSYNGGTIASDTLQDILRAAMAAPSGMDIRPWQFIVLTDKSHYDSIFEGNGNMKKFMESGAIVVVCADTTVTRPSRDNPDGPAVTMPNPMWRDDVAAATENLLLAVEAYGLGACWTACYPFPNTMAPVRKTLALPDNVIPYAIISIGHPAGNNSPKDKWDTTRIHIDRW